MPLLLPRPEHVLENLASTDAFSGYGPFVGEPLPVQLQIKLNQTYRGSLGSDASLEVAPSLIVRANAGHGAQ